MEVNNEAQTGIKDQAGTEVAIKKNKPLLVIACKGVLGMYAYKILRALSEAKPLILVQQVMLE